MSDAEQTASAVIWRCSIVASLDLGLAVLDVLARRSTRW